MRKLSNEELNRIKPEGYIGHNAVDVVIVLDNVRSMHNVGSCFRTADAFGITALYLCGITAVPPHREIYKTALGAEDVVPFHYFESTLSAVEALKKEGYLIAAVEQAEPKVWLHQFKPAEGQRICLVFGNEVDGVAPDVMLATDVCLEIKQLGTKHSVNIAVSVGVACFRVMEALNAFDAD